MVQARTGMYWKSVMSAWLKTVIKREQTLDPVLYIIIHGAFQTVATMTDLQIKF